MGVAVVLVVLLLGTVLALYVGRRWRLAVARNEQVRRLMRQAALQSEWAQREVNTALFASASFAVDDNTFPFPAAVPVAPLPGEDVTEGAASWAVPKQQLSVCAVCFKETTMRCASCKAVKYCSSMCQITHWRQVHKYECRPAKVDDRPNDISGVSESNKGKEASSSAAVDESFSENPELSDNKNLPRPLHQDAISVMASKSASDHMDAAKESKPHETSVHVLAHDHREPSVLPNREKRTRAEDYTELSQKKTNGSNGNLNHLDNLQMEAEHASSATSGFTSTKKSAKSSLSRRKSTEGKSNGPNHLFNGSTSGAVDGGYSQSSFKSPAGPPVEGVSKLSSVPLVYQDRPIGTDKNYVAKVHFAGTSLDGQDQVNHSKTRSSGVQYTNTSSSGVKLSSGNGDRLVVFDVANGNDNASEVVSRSAMSTGINLIGAAVSNKKFVKPHTPQNTARLYPSDMMLFPYDVFIGLYNSKVELHPFGLENLGNSCYANVVLQCLMFTRPLTAYLLEGIHSVRCFKTEWCLTCEFERLVKLGKEAKSPLSPTGILSHLTDIGSSFGPGKEEDAHEFLKYLIDTMQAVCIKESGITPLGHSAEETTLMQLTFGGYLCSKIRCTSCYAHSEKCERILDLSVEIHGDIDTLEKALKNFTATETLDGENKYYCSRCQSYERAKKKLTILEAPNVLTIALKRFQSGKFGKINKAVHFPDVLNLADYMSGSKDKAPVYSLYGVVVHRDVMNSAFSGHYICYVKDAHRNWYRVDDSQVRPATQDKVLSECAYMLLYARCSPRAPSSVRKVMSSQDSGNRIPVKTMPGGSGPFRAGQPLTSDPSAFYPYGLVKEGSETSSIFSTSDDSSGSSESTRISTSTEEQDLIYSGEYDHASSPNAESSTSLTSPSSSGCTSWRAASGFPSSSASNSSEGTDRSKQTSGFVELSRELGADVDSDTVAMSSNLLSRRPSRERTAAQTFY